MSVPHCFFFFFNIWAFIFQKSNVFLAYSNAEILRLREATIEVKCAYLIQYISCFYFDAKKDFVL